MTFIKYLFAFLFLLLSHLLLAQESMIELKAEQHSLEQIINQLEADYGLLFSYKETDIQAIQLTPPNQALSLFDFLTALLNETGLQFELIKESYVVLTKRPVIGEIPEAKPLVSLTGKVIDRLSQTALPYANIYLQKTQQGTSTTEDGSFQFQTVLEANDTLVFSYVGYEKKRLLASRLLQQKNNVIELSYLDYGEDFVLVTDYLTNGVSLNNKGAVTTLQPNQIGALPGQVEPDVLNTIHFLPGISSNNGAASSIHIRGGTPDQNLILWEDIPIYHSAHYFGMISAFNPYIINKVSVYRGGFDAEYGGRISGVIDLKSEDNTHKKTKFGVGTNFLNGYANGNVSFLNNKASIVYSLRHSLADIWRSPAFENITRRIHQGVLLDIPTGSRLPEGINITDNFRFFDSNIKINIQPTSKDKISVAWFYNQNDFKSFINDQNVMRTQSDSLFLESMGLSLSWNHEWKPGFSSKLLALTSDYHYNYKYEVNSEMGNNIDKFGLKKSKINEQQIHLLNSYETPKHHVIKMGYQLSNYDIAYRVDKEVRNNRQANKNSDAKSKVHVLYGAFNSANQNRFGLDVGLRTSYFQKEKRAYIEPRLRFWYQLSEALNLSLAGGRYYQFLSQVVEIEGDRASIETPVWVLAGDKEVPVLKADQIQIGGVFQHKSWLIDFQLYYKKINGLTSLSTGFDEDIGGQFYLGSANIRGLDILIKKRWKNYRSWISYSFTKVDHQFNHFFDTNFAASNDQPHQFHWVNTYTLGPVECSLGWKLKSGSPYSDRAFYRIKIDQMPSTGPTESIVPLTNSFNSERLPFQHQLDASIVYHLHSKVKNKWKAVIGLSVFNVYNQTNFYSRAFFMDVGPNRPPQLKYSSKSDLGITPNVVIRFEW